ncbi:hypothetical protein L798_13720 [Zootermopsis nevadensis]|uniref:Uncharacterized protein n=2 Tax=Zootermopsis nevadensis TaxID=136037 RepID=A0A067QRQ6_ZOONE|nr:hypothetical protein L798_13720 [Zootermopsis nevadensis]
MVCNDAPARTTVLLAAVWVTAFCQQFPGVRDCALVLPDPQRPGFNGIE